MRYQNPLITVLGPTAVGKTTFAAHLAVSVNAEIISADSRQVFRGMDIGTGKDKADYLIDSEMVAAHLIDIAEPGTEYNVFQFRHDFDSVYSAVISKGKTPLLCGGSGLYLESVLLGYHFVEAPVNEILRLQLAELTDADLIGKLSVFRPLHNTTDVLDRDRMIRAVEIEFYKQHQPNKPDGHDFSNTPVFGIRFERKKVRERISARLSQRLDEGMVDEVQQLLGMGISAERLKMYGLEYKYITMYLLGELNKSQMFIQLNTAIHQFAKRQMTWFRRMESKGIKIIWLEGEDGLEANLGKAIGYLNPL